MLAQCHLEAGAMWPGRGPKAAKRTALSPVAMRRCLGVFRTLACAIRRREAAQLERFRGAVARIEAVEQRMSEYNVHLVSLEPRMQQQKTMLEEQRQQLQGLKAEYMQQLELCKEQERLVETLKQPLEHLKKETQAEFDQVNPTYSAALEAMRCLNQNDIEEIRTYPAPPQAVKDVLDIVCLLCGVEESFKKAKELMAKENNGFFNMLQFYDKDGISEELFQKFSKAMREKNVDVEKMTMVSKSAAGLCQWLHAIYNYTLICRKMNPNLGKLLAAEERVNRAQSDLGKRRMKEEAMKQNLEKKIQEHRDAMKKMKELEKELQFTEARLKEAGIIKSHLLLYEDDWRYFLGRTRMRLRSVKADALLCAIIVTYLSLQPQETRQEIVDDWAKKFTSGENEDQNAVFNLRSPFSFKDIMLSAIFKDGKLGAQVQSEQVTWNILILRALLMSEEQQWPLIFDPNSRMHNHFETIVPPVENDREKDTEADIEPRFTVIDATKCDVEVELLQHCQRASTCFLLGLESHQELPRYVRTILSQNFFHEEGFGFFLNVEEAHRIACHPNFHLIVLLSLHPIQSYPGFEQLSACRLMTVDNSLGREDIARLAQKKLLSLERPEFEMHVASLAKDRFSGEATLFSERNHVLLEVLTSEANLIDRPDIIQTLRTSHDNILRQEEMLHEHENMLRQLHTKVAPLQGVIDNVLNLVMTLEEVTWTYQVHFCDALAFMDEMFRNFESVVRFPGLVGSPAARCQELVNFTTRAGLEFVNRIMNEAQVLVFVAQYCLRRIGAEGGASPEEVALFLTGPQVTEAELPAPTEHFNAEELAKAEALERNLPVFSGIAESLTKRGDQWRRYFQLPFSITSPTPEYYKFPNFSNFQKILIWKLLMPDKAKELLAEFAHHLLGSHVPLNRQFVMQRLLSLASPQSPVVLHVPSWSYDWNRSKGNSLVYILDAIIQMAPTEDPYSVTALNFGNPDVWNAATSALPSLAENGGWLVLQNMHLIEKWDQGFLNCLESILQPQFQAHPKFRLFFTTEDAERPLPVTLQRHGLKCVCNFTSNDEEAFTEVMEVGRRMKTRLRVTNTLSFEESNKLLNNISALVCGVHVVVCHQRFAGRRALTNDYPWQFSDLATVLAALANAGRVGCSASPDLARLLTREVYLSHLVEQEDLQFVGNLMEIVWRVVQDAEVARLPANRLCETIFEQVSANIGRTEEGVICSEFVSRLAQSVRAPPLGGLDVVSDDPILLTAERLRGRLKDFLEEFDAISEPSGAATSGALDPEASVELFMARERAGLFAELRQLLQRADNGCEVLSGTAAATSSSDAFVSAVQEGNLPSDWTALQSAPDLDLWFEALRTRLAYFGGWGDAKEKELRLLFFRHPRQLLQVLLKAEARAKRRDLKRMRAEFQIDPTFGDRGAFAVPNMMVRGARWCPTSRRLLPAEWRSVAVLPAVYLQISQTKAEAVDSTGSALDRCLLVRNDVLMRGEAPELAEVALELELPLGGEFARSPVLSQL